MDLSLGYYNLSCTSVLGNTPRVFDEEGLKVLLKQFWTNGGTYQRYGMPLVAKDKLKPCSLDPDRYGLDYLLGFEFADHVYEDIQTTGKKVQVKMINKPVALPREMVETALPSQRDYGYKSSEYYTIKTNKIVSYKVYEVTEIPNTVTNRMGDNSVRLSAKARLGYSTERYDLPSFRQVEGSIVDTHKPNEFTQLSKGELIELGFSVNRLGYTGKISSTDDRGRISEGLQSEKGFYGFSATKLKKTKTKMNSGGGCITPRNLSAMYAYASRYYKIPTANPSKSIYCRFLVAYGSYVYYQVANEAPIHFATFTHRKKTNTIIPKLQKTLTDKESRIWARFQAYLKTAAMRDLKTSINPVDTYTPSRDREAISNVQKKIQKLKAKGRK